MSEFIVLAINDMELHKSDSLVHISFEPFIITTEIPANRVVPLSAAFIHKQ